MTPTQTIAVRVFQQGAKDSHGKRVESLADPIDVPVFSIAPRFSNEPDETRGYVVSGLTVLAPVGTVIGPHDVVVIDGKDYEVDGEDADWTRGPFGWEPGVSINLKRAEG